MTRFVLSLLAVLAVASAFTAPLPATTRSAAAVQPLHMFSADDKPSPLSEVTAEDSKMEPTSMDESMASPSKPTMLVKNRNTGEMMEVEMNESFLANEKMEMSWWAWGGFVIFPVLLLSNDVFHFLPTDGPLGFLGRF